LAARVRREEEILRRNGLGKVDGEVVLDGEREGERDTLEEVEVV